MKKLLRIIVLTIMSIISIALIYTLGYRTVFVILNNRAVDQETQMDFAMAGKGVNWIHEGAGKTLFFIPSAQESAAEELYGPWLKELHDKQGVNIIIPPLKTSGTYPSLLSPVHNPDDRSRDLSYLYQMYSRLSGRDHAVTVLATGDGSIHALELAKLGVSIDKLILLSPVHGDRTVRGGNFFQKMASLPLLNFVMPWLPSGFGKNRMGPYDILNDELNEKFQTHQGKYYPRYINTVQQAQTNRSGISSAETLDEVKPNRFFIIYGDDDLTYSLEGFERMGDALKAGGSEVTIMRISASGRMLLFDNGRDRIVDLISILLQ